jgi:hypothetical protein
MKTQLQFLQSEDTDLRDWTEDTMLSLYLVKWKLEICQWDLLNDGNTIQTFLSDNSEKKNTQENHSDYWPCFFK